MNFRSIKIETDIGILDKHKHTKKRKKKCTTTVFENRAWHGLFAVTYIRARLGTCDRKGTRWWGFHLWQSFDLLLETLDDFDQCRNFDRYLTALIFNLKKAIKQIIRNLKKKLLDIFRWNRSVYSHSCWERETHTSCMFAVFSVRVSELLGSCNLSSNCLVFDGIDAVMPKSWKNWLSCFVSLIAGVEATDEQEDADIEDWFGGRGLGSVDNDEFLVNI